MNKFTPLILLKSRKDLIEALKNKKLPCAIPTLNGFEKSGIIKTPQFGLKRGENGFDRLYMEEEIEETIKNITNYVNNKGRNTFEKK